MERQYICEGKKYSTSATNTLALPVVSPELPLSFEYKGNNLSLKTSFHVSLVCINEIIRKHNISIPNFKDLVLEDFCNFTAQKPIEFIKYTDEVRYCEQEDLKSIVRMCEVSNLREFFEALNEKYHLNIEYPPTHVTLYTTSLGIFLTDKNDIKNFTELIPNPFN